jgi:integrase
LTLDSNPSLTSLSTARAEETVAFRCGRNRVALRAWLSIRGEVLAPELFINARDGCMTRAGFEYILRKHVRTAEKHCASLSSKRVSPHVLRHTCAMTILQATKDLRKVSFWLGHSSVQTTEIYTRADPTLKRETLESAIAPKVRTGRFKATDKLIALLSESFPRLCGVREFSPDDSPAFHGAESA